MLFINAGFVGFEITWRKDVFHGAPQESSAASFGTVGINFRARTALNEQEQLAAMGKFSCNPPAGPQPRFSADAFYDAGDAGCAYGPITKISKLIRELQAGQTLEVHATDPTVDVDLPAWLRMTGHTLVLHEESHFLIRKS